MLEAAFGWAAAGLTGISAGALGAVGGVAAVGGYSIWAAENPEDAAAFEQYLAENVVSQQVGSNQQLAMNLQDMPDSLKESIIDYVSTTYDRSALLPNITGLTLPDGVFSGLTLQYNGHTAGLYNMANSFLSDGYVNVNDVHYKNWVAVCSESNGNYGVSSIFYTSTDMTVSYDGTNLVFTNNGTDTARIDELFHPKANFQGLSLRLFGYVNAGQSKVFTNSFSDSRWYSFSGFDFGRGYRTLGVSQNVPAGLSGAFDNLVAGTGTAADVAIAGGVEAVYLPNVAINDGTVTVDDAYNAAGVTYPDIAITLSGGGSGTVPLPDDVLTALQQIIGLLTPMGIVTGIPPIVQDIDTKMGAIVDEWPGVMDILDGLGLLPPIVQDIADGMGVIIDIPQSLEDITDILLPIPQSLQGLLDGVTIDIPQTLAQILNGTLSIPTAIDGVISGVTALPAAIAGALDIDWVLENTEELKDRLPDLDAPLILPQASFDDLKNVANDYKERTPLGKIFEAYEGTFDVMSTSSQGAPRYEITFPSPINYTFVIDFAIFDGLFVQLAHAFFYLLAIFWYLKFIKRVKSWIDSWLTLGGGFAEVAEEESYAFRE